ncbi:tetratricopeptide repeat protein 33 isoform X1 [Mobula hypostoma]|uniref:tetratricopeptide repeat protein 33 isoform X1 n=1 Tax=Mobula hypostoma TaxID=723540 RepID=UPI002FC33F79
MTSFGWKRKVGEKVSKAASQVFEEAAEDGGLVDADVDWLHAAKRRRETLLEDCAVKSKRLKDEGVFLSENGRYWEAIGRWDEAIQLTPDCAALYEMKAQVLMILNEVFQAVQAAETAVRLNPQWWEAWQTLGRAQLSLDPDLELHADYGSLREWDLLSGFHNWPLFGTPRARPKSFSRLQRPRISWLWRPGDFVALETGGSEVGASAGDRCVVGDGRSLAVRPEPRDLWVQNSEKATQRTFNIVNQRVVCYVSPLTVKWRHLFCHIRGRERA